jgi:putative sterol carrier protein
MPALGDAAGNIRFDAPKLPGQQCKEDYMLVINGELSGPQGDQWWIDVNGGKYKMGKGKISDPNVTFVARDKDWVAVSNGRLGGTWAYMTGRLKVRGDQGLARKLGEIFP